MTSSGAFLDDTLAALIAICGHGAVLRTEDSLGTFHHDPATAPI